MPNAVLDKVTVSSDTTCINVDRKAVLRGNTQRCDLTMCHSVTGAIDSHAVGSSASNGFTSGSSVKTIKGCVKVEDLHDGDLIWTLDNGYRPIRSVNSSSHSGFGKLAPIYFEEGAFGNSQGLYVSREHRMLVSGQDIRRQFGSSEVLVAAKHLVNGDAIRIVEFEKVTYVSFAFDTHEIIDANGCLTESSFWWPDKKTRVNEGEPNGPLILPLGFEHRIHGTCAARQIIQYDNSEISKSQVLEVYDISQNQYSPWHFQDQMHA